MHPQHFLHVCDVVYISYIIFFELPVDVTTLLQRDVKGAVPFNGRFSFINTRHDVISEQFKIILHTYGSYGVPLGFEKNHILFLACDGCFGVASTIGFHNIQT